MFWQRRPQQPVGGGLSQLRETKQPRVLRGPKRPHHLGHRSCGHHGHIPSFSADVRSTPGALQGTVGGTSRLECASWDALFPWPAWSNKQLARRCITNITATPQSSGERIFPSHARFFALSDRSSKSDAEHQLRPWSFGITIVRASCRPTSVKESCCDTLFA